MSAALLTGSCPECETDLAVPSLGVGETLSCPECMLTLRVNDVTGGTLTLQMVEISLRDWGE